MAKKTIDLTNLTAEQKEDIKTAVREWVTNFSDSTSIDLIKNFKDSNLESVKKVKGLNKEVDKLSQRIPMVLCVANLAINKDWSKTNSVKSIINKFSYLETIDNLEKKLTEDTQVLDSIGVKVGDLKKIYKATKNIIDTYNKEKSSTDTEDLKSQYGKFITAIENHPELLDKLKKINSNFMDRGNPLRADIERWFKSSPNSSNNFGVSGSGSSGSGNSGSGSSGSGETGQGGENAENNGGEEQKINPEDVQDKVLNNVKTQEEINKEENATYFTKLFDFNPYKIMKKVSNDKNYDFNDEFESFSKALQYVGSLKDYFVELRDQAPAPKKANYEKALKKIDPAFENIKKYFEDAATEYQKTHELDYITSREARNLAQKICNKISSAQKEVMKIKTEMLWAGRTTKEEAKFRNRQYFRTKAMEFSRNIMQGTKTGMGARQTAQNMYVSHILKVIEKAYPDKEKAERIKNEFKNAFYDGSTDGQKKVQEILFDLEKIGTQKGINFFTAKPIRDFVVKNTWGKIKDAINNPDRKEQAEARAYAKQYWQGKKEEEKKAKEEEKKAEDQRAEDARKEKEKQKNEKWLEKERKIASKEGILDKILSKIWKRS